MIILSQKILEMSNAMAWPQRRCQILVLRTMTLPSGNVTHLYISSFHRPCLSAYQAGLSKSQPGRTWHWHSHRGPRTDTCMQPVGVTANMYLEQMSQHGHLSHTENQPVGKRLFREVGCLRNLL